MSQGLVCPPFRTLTQLQIRIRMVTWQCMKMDNSKNKAADSVDFRISLRSILKDDTHKACVQAPPTCSS